MGLGVFLVAHIKCIAQFLILEINENFKDTLAKQK